MVGLPVRSRVTPNSNSSVSSDLAYRDAGAQPEAEAAKEVLVVGHALERVGGEHGQAAPSYGRGRVRGRVGVRARGRGRVGARGRGRVGARGRG